ncbi:MAG: sigma-54-dependent transcriptional regulator [Pirellulales bacterium]
MAKFLVVDDEPADVALLGSLLEKLGHEVVTADTASDGLALVRREAPDVALLDILLPDENGLEVYRQMRALDGKLPILFVTASGSSNLAIEAMQLGAFDYLTKPLDVSKVRRAIERALEVRRMANEPVSMDPPSTQSEDGDVIIGRSPAMQDVYKAIGLVASQDVTVLIRGESGTGKELVARALYHFSKRADQPFLAVNCAAIPEALLESELFGHERGAFTGAEKRRIGKFEQCNRGTLFLDEIGDMPLLLQGKILRVLQGQTFERVGGNRSIKTDVRVITATHRDLERMVQSADFREDLLYRLNGYTIQLPPLRDRSDDLDLLIDHFRRQANRDLGKQVRGIAAEAMAILKVYRWPGNVRELQNVIRQAVLKTNGPVVLPDFLPEHVVQGVREGTNALPSEGRADSLQQLIDETLRSGSHQVYDKVVNAVEEEMVRRSLHHTGGDKLHAIQLLGVNPATFRSTAALELFELDADRATKDTREGDRLIRVGMTMEEIEREAIRQALEQTGGRRAEAAQMLGLSVRTLQRKIKEFDLR